MLDTRHRGVSCGQRTRVSGGQRTERGEWLTENAEGQMLDARHRGVGVGQRTQRNGCWIQDTEG